MAKMVEINENQENKKAVVNKNQKSKSVAEEKVGETEIYKYDFDFGCVRFRGLKGRSSLTEQHSVSMAKVDEINENQENTNQPKMKSVAEEKVGETEVYKYDYDFGYVRFRGLKVTRGRDLHLNVFDDVDSVTLKKRNAEISAMKKQIATPGESESSDTSAASAAAAAPNCGRVECNCMYHSWTCRQIHGSQVWKGLEEGGNLFNEENATGCTIM